MFEYKCYEKLTKEQILMKNGIFTIDRDKKHFIQHNDYFGHSTFFQCPKCKSFEVEREMVSVYKASSFIVRYCEDCGYQHKTDLNTN